MRRKDLGGAMPLILLFPGSRHPKNVKENDHMSLKMSLDLEVWKEAKLELPGSRQLHCQRKEQGIEPRFGTFFFCSTLVFGSPYFLALTYYREWER